MKTSEVVAALSFREFSRLCALLDEKGKASPQVDIGDGRMVGTAGRLRGIKFRVIRVCREARRVRVLIYRGGGFGETYWCELAS